MNEYYDRIEYVEPSPFSIPETPCRLCVEWGRNGPSHDGSTRCESGSIASGGTNSHCACDVCF
jgi:hypothetical protein